MALSLDCIGKPYESCMDVAGGLRALLVRPALALVRRPSRFPRALALGVVELLKALLLVLLNSSSKAMQAWAKDFPMKVLQDARAELDEMAMWWRRHASATLIAGKALEAFNVAWRGPRGHTLIISARAICVAARKEEGRLARDDSAVEPAD